MARVTAIIPAYNAEAFISQTIESVLAQMYQELEIIVVDDGSTDSTRRILQRYGDRIRYVYQKNTGVSTARNTGVSIATGEYIALLDHDDLWLPEKLDKQIRILDADPDVALVYSDCYLVDFNGRLLGKMFDSLRPHRGRVLAELFLQNFIPCPTVIMRKQVLDQVGLFSSDLCIAEEYEVFLKIAELYRIDFVDAPLAKYRVHETRLSRNIERGCKESIVVAEECLKRCPNLRHVLRTKARLKLGNLYYNLGQVCFSKTKTKEARRQFAQSLTSYPYQARAYLFYGLTFLPNEWSGYVTAWLRSMTASVEAAKKRIAGKGLTIELDRDSPIDS
ncbi:glycosyltransferase [Acidobacteria bacterium AH-259-A15]|nr:glycosyltransferase [Acidobacteria bacterium AH-259-A15]